MSASDSRKVANKAEETRKTAVSVKNYVSDTDHLLNHFTQLIKKASNLGKFEIEKQSFADDRFRDSVIDKVMDTLKEDGYNVSLTKQNALHQIIIAVTW